ncbi:NADPH:quinone reductase [Caenimonas terrae]|uniref:NADPH:quinone reductase n=1 Tax=Caenimonas terrae TaxID=696074 RepID=A0ABW0NBN0_9BURK
MRAAWYTRNGAARDVLVLGDIPVPAPAAGEVVVQVHASGVNPSDVKSRAGRPVASGFIVPHSDGAGIIVEAGPGVDRGRLGERVWLWNGQWNRDLGTAADYIVLPQEQAVALPAQVGFEAGACLGIPALTAIHALRRAGDLGGRTLLVTGAGSAVGHYVTQIAARMGAIVIGTAGSPARRDHALAAGAAHVIDYKREPVADRVKEITGGGGVDAVIDMDFSGTAPLLSQGLLRPHGRFVCYGSNQRGDLPIDFRTMLWGSHDLLFFLVYDLLAAERAAALRDLAALLAADALRHTIAASYPLEQIAEAHEMVEAGHAVGHVVLRLRE